MVLLFRSPSSGAHPCSYQSSPVQTWGHSRLPYHLMKALWHDSIIDSEDEHWSNAHHPSYRFTWLRIMSPCKQALPFMLMISPWFLVMDEPLPRPLQPFSCCQLNVCVCYKYIWFVMGGEERHGSVTHSYKLVIKLFPAIQPLSPPCPTHSPSSSIMIAILWLGDDDTKSDAHPLKRGWELPPWIIHELFCLSSPRISRAFPRVQRPKFGRQQFLTRPKKGKEVGGAPQNKCWQLWWIQRPACLWTNPEFNRTWLLVS